MVIMAAVKPVAIPLDPTAVIAGKDITWMMMECIALVYI